MTIPREIALRSKNEPPDQIDVSVGLAVRSRREALGLTQAELGQAIGVTFQQVQKYERGANRIAASMLTRIANRLETTEGDFFPRRGSDKDPGSSSKVRKINALADADEALSLKSQRILLSLARELQRATR